MALDTGHSNGSKNNTCRKRNWLTFDEGNSRGPGTALDAFLKKRVETMNHGGMKQPSPVLLNHATERSPLSVIDCYSNQFPVVTSQRISKGVRHRGPNLETLFKDRGSVENTPGVKRRSPNTDTLFDDRGSVEKTPAVKQNKPSRYFASGSGTKNLNLKFNEASDASLGTYLGHERTNLLVGSYFAISMCIGTRIVFAWEKLEPRKAKLMVPAVASWLDPTILHSCFGRDKPCGEGRE
ncbi:hypothetical protein ACET3Z_013509 [Daucus carota]